MMVFQGARKVLISFRKDDHKKKSQSMHVYREGLKRVGCGRGKGACAKDRNTKNATHSMQIERNYDGQDDDHIKNHGSIIKNH